MEALAKREGSNYYTKDVSLTGCRFSRLTEFLYDRLAYINNSKFMMICHVTS